MHEHKQFEMLKLNSQENLQNKLSQSTHIKRRMSQYKPNYFESNILDDNKIPFKWRDALQKDS